MAALAPTTSCSQPRRLTREFNSGLALRLNASAKLCAVTGIRLWKRNVRFSSNVYVRPSLETSKLRTTSGAMRVLPVLLVSGSGRELNSFAQVALRSIHDPMLPVARAGSTESGSAPNMTRSVPPRLVSPCGPAKAADTSRATPVPRASSESPSLRRIGRC